MERNYAILNPERIQKGMTTKLNKIALPWLVFVLVLLPVTTVLLMAKPIEAG